MNQNNQTVSAEKIKKFLKKESEKRKSDMKKMGEYAEKFRIYGMTDKELLSELTRPTRDGDAELREAVRRIYKLLISIK